MKRRTALLIVACGAASVTVGVALLSIPAALIVGGFAAVGVGLLAEYR